MPRRTPGTLAAEIKQTRPFASPAQEATIALLRTTNVVRTRIARLVAREDVTLQQYNVLRILRGADGPLSALEIQDRLVEDAPGVSRLIDRLVAKSLVRRDRGTADRRLLECWEGSGGPRAARRRRQSSGRGGVAGAHANRAQAVHGAARENSCGEQVSFFLCATNVMSFTY
jgi:hypothetical protein